jgi:aminoglycoside phosphotransferase family enzyme/predicted kinase
MTPDGPDLTPDEQQALVEGLRAFLQASCAPGQAVAVLETHISWVLVTPQHAWKLKKPLDLGFLDFRGLARRRHFCEEELRLNRRLAPQLYLAVQPVTGSLQHPRLGGAGPVLDWAVQMRAFDQAQLWDRLAAQGRLGATQVQALAEQLHRFQASAAVAGPAQAVGRASDWAAAMQDNFAVMNAAAQAWPDLAPALAELQYWHATHFPAWAPLMAQRLASGHVREGHGDLHLGNVATVDGAPVVFDCIEFNEAFRWGDVMGELAFLAMDLHAHGLPALAWRFLDSSLALSGDHAGLPLLRWFMAYRALVRAKVAWLGWRQHGRELDAAACRRYVATALQLARPDPAPRLVITHGFSGSGKSTAALALAQQLGGVRIRADVERKRLAGLAPHEPSGSALHQGLYSEAATQATYARLLQLARPVLAGGFSAILDASFLQRARRHEARALAAELGVAFEILDCHAPAALLQQRLSTRLALGSDASEATAEVLAAQQRRAQPLDGQELACVRPNLPQG